MSLFHFRLCDVMKEYEKRRQSSEKVPDESEYEPEKSLQASVEPEPKHRGLAMFLAMLIILLPPLILAAVVILIIFYLFI